MHNTSHYKVRESERKKKKKSMPITNSPINNGDNSIIMTMIMGSIIMRIP